VLPLALLLAAAAAAAAAPVAAPTAQFDAQCVLASQAAIAGADADKKAVLLSVVTYFSGRLDAELPDSNLLAVLEQAGKSLENQPLGPVMQRCGDFMKQRGATWMSIGEQIQARHESGKTS